MIVVSDSTNLLYDDTYTYGVISTSDYSRDILLYKNDRFILPKYGFVYSTFELLLSDSRFEVVCFKKDIEQLHYFLWDLKIRGERVFNPFIQKEELDNLTIEYLENAYGLCVLHDVCNEGSGDISYFYLQHVQDDTFYVLAPRCLLSNFFEKPRTLKQIYDELSNIKWVDKLDMYIFEDKKEYTDYIGKELL